MPVGWRVVTAFDNPLVMQPEVSTGVVVGIVYQNKVGQASGRQKSVGDDLREMLDILSNRREHELSRLVKKLREAEREGSLPSVSKEERKRIESPPEEPQLDLDEQELKEAEQSLAHHIGPIARVIVKRAHAECTTRDAFYDRLAEELTDPAERDEFLSNLN